MKLEQLLSIGKILNFHGINGEVKAGYTVGNEKQLTEIKEIYAIKNEEKIKLTIKNVRFHKNSAIIKFNEINSVDQVIELKGAILKAEKSKLEELLEEDVFYIDDLVGLKAFNKDGALIGEVKQVGDQRQGNVLAINDEDGNEFLIPFVKDLVPEIDMKNKRLVINNIPGLLEKKTNEI